MPDAAFVPALTKAGWAERDDGVGSESMLAMLVALHHEARTGRRIDIVAFSGVKDEAQARQFAQLPGQGRTTRRRPRIFASQRRASLTIMCWCWRAIPMPASGGHLYPHTLRSDGHATGTIGSGDRVEHDVGRRLVMDL